MRMRTVTGALAVAGMLSLPSVNQAIAQDAAALVNSRCGVCHEERADGTRNRISDARKTPEAWGMTLTRMVNIHGLKLAGDEHRTLVTYLSNTQGLAPSESKGYRYVLEKTPGVTDVGPTDNLTQFCGRCHTYARVALQRRTKEDWLKLVHFHLGQFPTAEYQALGRDRDWWGGASTTVVDELAKLLPLESDAWTNWKGKAAPDLSGGWRFTGHRPGAGDYAGMATLSANGKGGYDITTKATYADGNVEEATGAAVVYSGHEFRASLKGKNGASMRVVMSTGGNADTLAGRWFVRDNDVIGGTINSAKQGAAARILAVQPAYIKHGETAKITIHGTGLAGDVSLGSNLKFSEVDRSADSVTLEVTADAGAATGARDVAVGGTSSAGALVVYDKVDSVKVVPDTTIARVGGNGGPIAPMPAQFEAVGYMAGADGKAGTEDDVRIGVMPASWSTANFDETAEALKDKDFAGKITGVGLFEPAGAGPNPARPMSTNNAGNLSVIGVVDDGSNKVEGKAHLFVTVQRFVDPPIR